MRRAGATLGMAILLLSAGCDRPPDLAASALRPVPLVLSSGLQGAGKVWEAQYSPDGRKIAFLRGWDRGAMVVTSQDGESQASTPMGYEVHSFAWLPDSGGILTAHAQPGDRWFDPDRLAVWNPEGGLIRSVSVDERFVADQGLAVSPDGRYAVAAATGVPGTPGYDGGSDLLLIALDLGFVRNLTRTPWLDEHSPDFVDEDRVIFGRTSAFGRGAAMSLDLTTGKVRRLGLPEHDVVEVTTAGGVLLYGAYTETLQADTTCFWRVRFGVEWPTPLFCSRGASPDLAPEARSLLLTRDPPDGGPWRWDFGGRGRVVEVALSAPAAD